MDIYELTVNQLKRAAVIKEHIEALNRELRGILGVSSGFAAPSTKKSTMSASVKRKIAATQKASWARIRQAIINWQCVQTDRLRRPRKRHLAGRRERSCRAN
jgi:hypothetical protein